MVGGGLAQVGGRTALHLMSALYPHLRKAAQPFASTFLFLRMYLLHTDRSHEMDGGTQTVLFLRIKNAYITSVFPNF